MTTNVEFIPVRCPHCGAVLGRMAPRGEAVKLLADGWEIGEGTRACPDCRKGFVFKAPKLAWEALVARWYQVNGRVLDGIMEV